METSLKRIELIIEKHQDFLKRKGYSPRTQRGYKERVRDFIKYLREEEKIEDLKEVDKQVITRYQTYLYSSEKKLSLGTQIAKLIGMRSFFKYLEIDDILLYDPTAHVELPKKPERLPMQIFSRKEIEKLLGGVDIETRLGLRDRAMLELVYSTGVRASELISLDIYDIDFERGMIRIRGGKGGRDRVLPIGEIAKNYLEEYINQWRKKILSGKEENALFLSAYGKRLAASTIASVVKYYAGKVGIKRRTTTHMIRHTMATHMLKKKAPIRYIQEMLGHKDLNTTQLYTQVEISDLKKIHKKTHPRELE